MSTRESEYHGILEFIGDQLDPAEVQHLTALNPTPLFKKKGDLMSKSHTARARTGFCGFSTAHLIASDDPNDHIFFLLQHVNKRQSEIVTMIKAKSIACKIVCISHGREYDGSLTAENLAMADRTGIEILFQKEFQGVTFVEEPISLDERGDVDRRLPVQKS